MPGVEGKRSMDLEAVMAEGIDAPSVRNGLSQRATNGGMVTVENRGRRGAQQDPCEAKREPGGREPRREERRGGVAKVGLEHKRKSTANEGGQSPPGSEDC